METITLNTYKVSSKLPLSNISSFFNLKTEAGWKEYIKLNGNDIGNVLKYSSHKKVYLYKYGCISFVGFNQDEIYLFLDYLRKSFVEIDSNLISKYNESHTMFISEENIKLWSESEQEYKYNEGIIDIVAAVLAKSTELNKIETELSIVLDDADVFIGYLKKGKLRANKKKVVATIADCIRFKYNTLESARLLDRPSEFNTIKSIEIFDLLSDYYELSERYNILSNRINILDSITGEYFSFRSNQSENRLILFEVLLLCLFPLMRLLS